MVDRVLLPADDPDSQDGRALGVRWCAAAAVVGVESEVCEDERWRLEDEVDFFDWRGEK